MTSLIDALAAVGALCLFCTAALLVIVLTDDGELEERPTEADRAAALHAEIERLRRHNTRQGTQIYQLIDQRDERDEEIQLLNQALTEQVYRDQCKQAHPGGGRTLDPRQLAPWRRDN